MSYWHEIKKAINVSYDKMPEEYEKLSQPVKDFLGSARQLEEYAMMDSATLNTVAKGQFLKQIEVILARKKEKDNLMPETKQLISQMANTLSLTNEI